jgi:hypothetical protein
MRIRIYLKTMETNNDYGIWDYDSSGETPSGLNFYKDLLRYLDIAKDYEYIQSCFIIHTENCFPEM